MAKKAAKKAAKNNTQKVEVKTSAEIRETPHELSKAGATLRAISLRTPVRGGTATEVDGERVNIHAADWDTREAGKLSISVLNAGHMYFDSARGAWVIEGADGVPVAAFSPVCASEKQLKHVETSMGVFGGIGAEEIARRARVKLEADIAAQVAKLVDLGLPLEKALELTSELEAAILD